MDCVVLKAAVLATQAESEEAKAAAKDFEDADVDGDGALSTEEFLKAASGKGIPEAEGEALFKALDTSGNGKVASPRSHRELSAASPRRRCHAATFLDMAAACSLRPCVR